MRSATIFSITFIFSLLIVSSCKKSKGEAVCQEKDLSNSFLWKLKRNPPAYFFGTIHVPYTKVWNFIPSSSMKALERSDNVVFELDLTNPGTRIALSRCQMLPKGTGLREVLPVDLYQRLKRHLEYIRKAMPGWVTSDQKIRGYYGKEMFESIVGNWERKKPVWVMLMINSLTEADIRSRDTPVLDHYLARQAERMGKEVGAVEKVDEQCQPLNGLNISQVIYALNHTLTTLEKQREGELQPSYSTDDLIKQYNCGDLDSILLDIESTQVHQVTNKSGQDDGSDPLDEQEDSSMATEIDAYFKEELIRRRNKRMTERVKHLLDENPHKSFFFAFGAGHFLGNESVIEFLRKDGYQIHNVKRKAFQKNRARSSKKRSQKGLRQKKRLQRIKKRKQRLQDLWAPTADYDETILWGMHQRNFDEQETAWPSEESDTDIHVVNYHPTLFPQQMRVGWLQTKSRKVSSHRWRPHYRSSLKDDKTLPKDLAKVFEAWTSETATANNSGSSIFSFQLSLFIKCFALLLGAVLLTLGFV